MDSWPHEERQPGDQGGEQGDETNAQEMGPTGGEGDGINAQQDGASSWGTKAKERRAQKILAQPKKGRKGQKGSLSVVQGKAGSDDEPDNKGKGKKGGTKGDLSSTDSEDGGGLPGAAAPTPVSKGGPPGPAGFGKNQKGKGLKRSSIAPQGGIKGGAEGKKGPTTSLQATEAGAVAGALPSQKQSMDAQPRPSNARRGTRKAPPGGVAKKRDASGEPEAESEIGKYYSSNLKEPPHYSYVPVLPGVVYFYHTRRTLAGGVLVHK